MTWEETIHHIRTKEEYKYLVEKAYFDENLLLNVERYRLSEEYKEVLKEIRRFKPDSKIIIDVGSGNGISAVSFAIDGFEVHSLEPDSSITVGLGAIKTLKEELKLENLYLYNDYAENCRIPVLGDVVFVRQALHHANDLKQFVANLATLIVRDGLFFSIRDHVVNNKHDKELFLKTHPLHKFYLGENAFTLNEYKDAISNAKLELVQEYGHYDSVINYFPMTVEEFKNYKAKRELEIENSLKNKIGFLSRLFVFKKLYYYYLDYNPNKPLDSEKIPGRLSTFIALKK